MKKLIAINDLISILEAAQSILKKYGHTTSLDKQGLDVGSAVGMTVVPANKLHTIAIAVSTPPKGWMNVSQANDNGYSLLAAQREINVANSLKHWLGATYGLENTAYTTPNPKSLKETLKRLKVL